MKDPNLLEATGSEPLSYQEEVEMQQSWRDDPNKCTFIVHVNNCFIDDDDNNDDKNDNDENVKDLRTFSVPDNLHGMVGDVNLFLSEMDIESETDQDEGANKKKDDTNNEDSSHTVVPLQAEIDIMIAENDQRRQGLGKEAVCAMMLYGTKQLHVQRFFCKINEDNVSSINLFQGLGFVQCDYAACFKQVELELIKPTNELEQILGRYGTYEQIPCPLHFDT